jgi:hypothetical protein
MIEAFILACVNRISLMPRRTIYLPESAEKLVREQMREGESFSATVVRLIERGALDEGLRVPLSYVGAGDGPGDLGINAEKYLGLKPWRPGEGPADEGPG